MIARSIARHLTFTHPRCTGSGAPTTRYALPGTVECAAPVTGAQETAKSIVVYSAHIVNCMYSLHTSRTTYHIDPTPVHEKQCTRHMLRGTSCTARRVGVYHTHYHSIGSSACCEYGVCATHHRLLSTLCSKLCTARSVPT